MAKPKGELGLAIMLGGKSKKSSPFDSEEEDTEETSEEESEESSDPKLAKKAALLEEMESCKAEDDWEGAAKALTTFIKHCKY